MASRESVSLRSNVLQLTKFTFQMYNFVLFKGDTVVEFAILNTGGKQYRVKLGDTIRVEKLDCDQGDTISIDEVKLVSSDGKIQVGSPNVVGASVKAEVVANGKDKKVVVFKYKAKTRYRRKNGHRQHYTDLRITEIFQN
jgi:large subunit ribosomal protein L21